MRDLMLSFESLTADLSLADQDLQTDDGLQTAIIISLFTDRRAGDDDRPPADAEDRRGWWGDMLAEVEDDRIGSRLWLLSREKDLPEVLARAEEYATEALRWLLEDGVVEDVHVSALSPKRGWLHLSVSVRRKGGTSFQQEYSYSYGDA